MLRRFVAPFALCVAVVNLSVQAQPVVPKQSSDSVKPLKAQQDELMQLYKGIIRDLRTLQFKLEKSSRIEDQNKANLIKKAIATAEEEGVDNKFSALARSLTGKDGTIKLDSFSDAERQNKELVVSLKLILRILETDDGIDVIRRQQKYLEEMLKELKGIIRAEKIERVNNLGDKGDPTKRAKDQDKRCQEDR